MSMATATAKVYFRRKSGTYTAYLSCSYGDLYQFYQDKGDKVTFTPDFSTAAAADKPVIEFKWSNSRGESNLALSSINWYYNDVQLFLGGAYDSIFQSISLGKIKVVDNFTDKVSGVLRCEATISNSLTLTTDAITCSYGVSVTEATSGTAMVTIAAETDDKCTEVFMITNSDAGNNGDNPGYSCLMKAMCFDGSSDVSNSKWYRWYYADPLDTTNGGWTEITASVSKKYTLSDTHNKKLRVYNDAVNWTATFKVVAYNDEARTQEFGMDTQTVLDNSDELRIGFAYNPEDRTITEGDTTAVVTITPTIYSKEKGTTPTQYQGATFDFRVVDLADLTLATDTGTSFDVTHDMALMMGGDIDVIVQNHESAS